jgi:hypothetical protein
MVTSRQGQAESSTGKLPLTLEKGDESCEDSTKIGMVTNFERVTHGQRDQMDASPDCAFYVGALPGVIQTLS